MDTGSSLKWLWTGSLKSWKHNHGALDCLGKTIAWTTLGPFKMGVQGTGRMLFNKSQEPWEKSKECTAHLSVWLAAEVSPLLAGRSVVVMVWL